LERLGALITKTLTRAPREGHPPPRLVETPSGMLNAVGLQNIGIEAFLQEKLPALKLIRVPVIVSILGESVEDVVAMTSQLDRADGVAAIELNLSCPNLQRRSGLRAQGSGPGPHPPAQSPEPLMVAQDADATSTVVSAARAATNKPLIAKLSPDVTDLAPIAQAAERAGADTVSLVNTFRGMSLDPATRRSRLGVLTGGVSGPAIRPLAVYRVWYTAQTVRIPVIGLGGIVRAEDALEFFLAGASAVAVGTANFANPRSPLQVLEGLTRYLARHGLSSLRELQEAIQHA
ncbi:MAG: dihydroorotate dehydrogenase, partial [Candidatus Omnitrophica bacterium]|nr:dihydroorotate dehydrogenase [Candidatus Omnitrophota bacterium]